MLDRNSLREMMRASEGTERGIYVGMTSALYLSAQTPLEALFDQTVRVTDDFRSITPSVIRANPRIIKILRHCLCPVVSQMRLGQLLGMATTGVFEEGNRVPTLAEAEELAHWFEIGLDVQRFPWSRSEVGWTDAEKAVARRYAKLWTIALAANQNTGTLYRTQRKERQEAAIVNSLLAAGLTLQTGLVAPPSGLLRPAGGGIHFPGDIGPRNFVKEKKILADSQKKQKADVIARPTEGDGIFCIEAKAVGIRIDSTKRLKELNDKFTDWTASSLPITTVGVIAGFFNEVELIATIKDRGIPVFFEHDLTPLAEFLLTGRYFGQTWNPKTLFPEVSDAEILQAAEGIATAAVDGPEASTGDVVPDAS